MSDDGPSINVTRGKRKDKEKKNKSAQSRSSSNNLPGAMEMASGLAESARNVWLAGLGALSVAEDAGTKVFNALVEQGKSWEEQRRKQQKQTAEQVKTIQEEGTRAVEAVEERVRDEVNDALRRLGVPHRDDIDELRHQVDALSEKMEQIADAVAEQQDDEG